MDVPADAEGEKTQPVAVPAFEKSEDEIPDTGSENVIPNDCVIPDAGDEGADVTDAVGLV